MKSNEEWSSQLWIITRSRVQPPLKSWIFFRLLCAIVKIAIITARIWFHICSSHMIYFICIIHLHIFHGNIWTQNWPAPNVSGFIAQLVEHRTGIARSRVQAPLKSWIFFQASLRNCKNCDHNCEDHSSFDNVYSSFWSVRPQTRQTQCLFFVLKREATNATNTMYILRSVSVRPQTRQTQCIFFLL